jgi:hypothetical protein
VRRLHPPVVDHLVAGEHLLLLLGRRSPGHEPRVDDRDEGTEGRRARERERMRSPSTGERADRGADARDGSANEDDGAAGHDAVGPEHVGNTRLLLPPGRDRRLARRR